MDGLLKSGLIPWSERPIWYDDCRAFPPDRDPTYRTILGNDKQPPLPPKILYKEDEARALVFNLIFFSVY